MKRNVTVVILVAIMYILAYHYRKHPGVVNNVYQQPFLNDSGPVEELYFHAAGTGLPAAHFFSH